MARMEPERVEEMDEIICEECEQVVDGVATEGRFTGVCCNCEQEMRREDAQFTKDHIYVFGNGDY